MLGKDYWIAGIILWWLWTRRNALVIVTGPGQTTIGTVTWKELRAAVRSCPFANRGLPLRISDGAKTSPQTATVRPGWHALGYSTTSVERASGHHAADLLVIVEEASGVEDEAWEAIDSLGASKVVAIGNPLRPDGGFARRCEQGDADLRDGIPPSEATCHFNVPATASPDAASPTKRTGLAWGGWIAQQIRQWGKDSLWVMAHILAIRPKVASGALIPEAWLDLAASQPPREALPPNHPIHATRRISCDLGEGVGRDSSCILVRDDWGVLEVIFGSALGLPEAAERMWRMGLKWEVPASRMSYDKVGIGRAMPNHLAKHGLRDAVGVAGSAAPMSSDFSNLRTEAAMKFRWRLDPLHVSIEAPHRLQRPFAIPAGDYWPRMREELKALTYSLAGRKTKLLPKEDWAEILGHSPDLADALIQSFMF